MPKDQSLAGSSLVEVVDRILDKGIVIDAWVSVSVIGIELVTIEARVVVASVETYVKYAGALGYIGPIAGGLRHFGVQEGPKSLAEGIKELTEGLVQGVQQVGKATQNVPLVGNVGQQAQSITGGVLGGKQREREKVGTTKSSKTRTTKAKSRKSKKK